MNPASNTRWEAKRGGFYSCERFSERDVGENPELRATGTKKTADSRAGVWREAKAKLADP